MRHETVTVLMPDKVEPFKAIVREVIKHTGSINKARIKFGVSYQTLTKCLNESYLTARSARLILSAYRNMKSELI